MFYNKTWPKLNTCVQEVGLDFNLQLVFVLLLNVCWYIYRVNHKTLLTLHDMLKAEC